MARKRIDLLTDMIGDGTPGSNPFRPRIFDSHIPGEDMNYERGLGFVVCVAYVDEVQVDKFDSDGNVQVINKDNERDTTEKEKPMRLADVRNLITFLGVKGVTSKTIADKLGVKLNEVEPTLSAWSKDEIINFLLSLSGKQKEALDERRLLEE